ncbi:MAG TPA: NAD(P)-binding domain-containing protein [Pyrinomonadaceae bacterium]|nr:NAD(P)-binding domain-containing protein [Pyrinomonadaceae bacterium]
MKIGIIGAGNIGANAAKLFVEAGHEIAVANSRGAETLRDLINELGGERAQAASVEEAARFGEIVFVSIPFGKYRELPAEAFDGKIVIDSNNYYPERDGNFSELDNNQTSSSVLLAEHLGGGARIVKAFNTIWFEHLKTQGRKDLPVEERRAIFIAGDDAEAKAAVTKLIEDIGFAAVDTGDLADGGLAQQPGTALYNRNLTSAEAYAIISAETY